MSLLPAPSSQDRAEVAAADRAEKRPPFEMHAFKDLLEPNETVLAAQEPIPQVSATPVAKNEAGLALEAYALAPIHFGGATLVGGGLVQRGGFSARFFFFFQCAALDSVRKLVEADLGPAASLPSRDLAPGLVWKKPEYTFKIEHESPFPLRCHALYQVDPAHWSH